MSWFGWLTKPALQVSALDKLICTLELTGLVIVAGLFVGWLEVRAGRKRRGEW